VSRRDFNILGILGVTALIAAIPVAPALIRSDFWWMIGTALLLLPLMRWESRITRPEGGLLLAVYVTYLILLLRG